MFLSAPRSSLFKTDLVSDMLEAARCLANKHCKIP